MFKRKNKHNKEKDPITDEEKKDDVKEKKAPAPSIAFSKLFRFATRTELLLIVIAGICSAGTGVLLPASILIFGDLINDLTGSLDHPSQLLEFTLPAIHVMVYIGVAAFATGYVSNCLWIVTGAKQTRRIRSLYLHSVLKQDTGWFDAAEDGSLNTRLAADTQIIQDGISEKFGQLIASFAQFFGGLIVSFVKGWRLSLIILSLVPLLSAFIGGMAFFVSKFTNEAQKLSAEAGTVAEQAFQSVRTVYSFTLQKKFSALYKEKTDAACRSGMKRGISTAVGSALFMFVMFSSFALSLWYGSTLVIKGISTGGDVYVVFMAMMIGTSSIMRISTTLTAVASALGAAFKVFEVIDRVPSINTDDTTGLSPDSLQGSIEFKDATFNYPTRPDLVILDKLNIEIKPGMTVAFVGHSGSGKSTTVNLVQRFYDLTSGQVLVDGHDVKDLSVTWLRQQIGVVSQEPVLFNMTIRKNVMMGSQSDVTEAEVIAACKESNCHTFITQLPNGYDTIVGEQGGLLSGGQKQRIAIARAILKNPTILLLDEATSALDTQSERLVQNALDKASVNRTTIVIAHRLSTVMKSDLIVVLDHGKILEQGTHETLIRQKGAYHNLVEKQMIELTQDNQVESKDVDTGPLDAEALLLQEQIEVRQKIATQEQDAAQIAIDMDEKKDKVEEVDAYDLKLRREQELQHKMDQQRAPIIKVLRGMNPERKYVIGGLLGAAVSGCIFPLYSFTFAKIIGILSLEPEFIQPSPLGGTNLYAFIFVIIGIVSFFSMGAQLFFFEVTGEKYTQRLRVQVFDAYMRQEVGFFDREENNTGALTAKLAVDAKNVNDLITRVCGDISSFIATVISGFIISFIHSWALSLIVLCMSPFMIAATAYEYRIELNYTDSTQEANAKSNQVAGEAIREARTVASLNKQSYFEDRYVSARLRPHQMALRKAYFSSIASALSKSMNIFTSAVAFYAGVNLIMKGQINFTQMLVSMTVIMVTAESVGVFSTSTSAFTKAKYAAIASFQIIERKTEIDPELEGLEPALGTVRGDVDFKDIKFSYPSRPDISIFKGEFNLQGMAGKTIALVGPSGCGKSTTIGLLQRWYDPMQGTVSLDHKDVKSYSLNNLRSHMAVVAQEPVLFDMTIGENILFGADDQMKISQEEIESACKASNIHEFITSLPKGYDTRVGDKGSQLSGGQKQRIAIARAVIRKPRVLLLDEATSALDSDSERLVQDALDNIIQEGGRTTITIAHRLSTIQNSDLICVIKDGLVIEQGTHWELLALNGVYSQLVHEQSLSVL
ncbi:P-loop containing nucleoside triphosphate hydrolase protein [Helicostylum pulchrum]|nr:P-loop containing nucleoside triphosphate hydrolase protein [Helicostylum pulchrum]